MKPSPSVAKEVVVGKFDIVEMQLDMGGAANAHHRLVAAHGEAGRILVDQKHGNAAMFLFRVGDGGDDEEIRPKQPSEMKCFIPVQHPFVVALAHRLGVLIPAASDPAPGSVKAMRRPDLALDGRGQPAVDLRPAQDRSTS